ncbi:sulfurtransferase-like selenium metabolism protein YedF [Tenuifilum osseticum]|uniref:sulfurtransferase-like selenium metabolism protein YedF n=1 Tax=Tenuifilum osseticum TaxID=3374723 RepID=UPI0034E43B8C
MTKIIDCRGQLCPQPLINTKKALKESVKDETIQVLIDNATSCQNVSRFLADNAIPFTVDEQNGLFTLTINPTDSEFNTKKEAEEYCEVSFPPRSKKYIVVLTSHLMGNGDNDLGKILMKGFLNTLPSLEGLPEEIICYNSAVTLAVKGSDTAQSLVKLMEMGVKITLCGTCVDFFSIKDKIEVGTISNMLYIAERLSSGIHTVKP